MPESPVTWSERESRVEEEKRHMASVEEAKDKKGPAEWRGLVFAASKPFLESQARMGAKCPPQSLVLIQPGWGRMKAAAAAGRAQREHRLRITDHFIPQILQQ